MKPLLTLILCLGFFVSIAQNTVGTLLNTEDSYNGFTLFSGRLNDTPRFTYLINNCGEIINTWESEFPLFGKEILLPDGTLYRAVVDDQSTLGLPGNTGRIEHLDWDGNLIWGLTLSDTDFSFHHDFDILPNGNLILIVAQRRTEQEAIDNGRDPATISNGELYEETIVEIEPVGSGDFNVVWEWNSWNHLIQDFDDTKLNFGSIADSPGRVDINFAVEVGEGDWWHANALSYSPERDQIILSIRDFDEFIIIDHSTTTQEAATDSGGNSGRGGRILYRYGNPESYQRGTAQDRVLDAQHNVQFIAAGSPNAGKISIFNNNPIEGFSSVLIIDPEFDEATSTYVNDGGAFGPDAPDFEYSDPENFFAPFLSGAQEFPNGNILINNGPSGFFFEIDPSQNNEIVWSYQNPVGLNGILSDGDNPDSAQTFNFRALRYPVDFPAFEGRDLTPQGVIELNPADFACETLSVEDPLASAEIRIFPNPAANFIEIQTQDTPIDQIDIFDLSGKKVVSTTDTSINIASLKTGVYLLQIQSLNTSRTLKLIKQ